MRTLIIYVSVHHKNTEKVAKVLAKTLKTDLVDLCQKDVKSIENYDLIGFGSGIYMWKHHRLIIDFVNKLSKTNKKVFIFSTAGAPPFLSFIQHKTLKNKLIEKGFDIVGELCLPGWDTYGVFGLFGGFNRGRPNKDDLQKVKEFAKNLIK